MWVQCQGELNHNVYWLFPNGDSKRKKNKWKYLINSVFHKIYTKKKKESELGGQLEFGWIFLLPNSVISFSKVAIFSFPQT